MDIMGFSSKKIPNVSNIYTEFHHEERSKTPSITPIIEKKFPMYIAVNEYFKRMDDELDMKPGDKIQVITDDQEYNDGWYYGRNMRTNKEGLYPKVFTQEISTQQNIHLNRDKSPKRMTSPVNNIDNIANQSESVKERLMHDSGMSQDLDSYEIDLDRNSSFKNTMSDIDKALEELRAGSIVESTHGSLMDDVKNQELENVSTWTPEQVTAYFISIGFDAESSAKFQQHKISGSILLELELSHLKELEINSFGTRFEMFKEIETIKELVVNKNKKTIAEPIQQSEVHVSKLMPAPSFDQRLQKTHMRKESHSLDDLPSAISQMGLSQQQSESKGGLNRRLDPLTLAENRLDVLSDEVFLSPRKAPKPPPFLSPIQPSKSPVNDKCSSSPNSSTLTPNKPIFRYPSTSTNLSSEISRYQFPRSSQATSTPALQNPYSSTSEENTDYLKITDAFSENHNPMIDLDRNVSHKKAISGGSFVELFNRISMLSPHNKSSDNMGISSNKPLVNVYPHSGMTSTSYDAENKQLPQSSVSEIKKHKRNSSLLSFFNREDGISGKSSSSPKNLHSRTGSLSHVRRNSLMNPLKPFSIEGQQELSDDRYAMINGSTTALSVVEQSKKETRSVSVKDPNKIQFFNTRNSSLGSEEEDKKKKRSVSEAVKAKTFRSMSMRNLSKKQTSAFMEGIRNITVDESVRDADCSGWMSKKGAGAMGIWKNRFFTLHGTRLSYFSSISDSRERGLIDITAHRVLPAKEDDKFVALYAASTGKGRYCFKLMPPQPGSKKGLTFTQPRIHYFALDTLDEMRTWMAALIKATIDVDTSVPIISSCATPTISLIKAQEMLLQAREETRLREEQRFLNEEDEDQMLWEQQQQEQSIHNDTFNRSTPNTSVNTSNVGYVSPYLLSSNLLSPNELPIQYNVDPNNGNNVNKFGCQSHQYQNDEYFNLDPKYMKERI